MGFLSKAFKKTIGGVANVLGLSDYSVDMSSIDDSIDYLKSSQQSDAKRRKSLYFTQGGVLGDRLQNMGSSSRGNLFS